MDIYSFRECGRTGSIVVDAVNGSMAFRGNRNEPRRNRTYIWPARSLPEWRSRIAVLVRDYCRYEHAYRDDTLAYLHGEFAAKLAAQTAEPAQAGKPHRSSPQVAVDIDRLAADAAAAVEQDNV